MIWSKPNVSDLVAKRDTKRVREVANVEMEAEIGVVWLQAKNCWKLPETGREAWDRLSLGASRRTNPANILILNSGLLTCENVNFCCFEPASL